MQSFSVDASISLWSFFTLPWTTSVGLDLDHTCYIARLWNTSLFPNRHIFCHIEHAGKIKYRFFAFCEMNQNEDKSLSSSAIIFLKIMIFEFSVSCFAAKPSVQPLIAISGNYFQKRVATKRISRKLFRDHSDFWISDHETKDFPECFQVNIASSSLSIDKWLRPNWPMPNWHKLYYKAHIQGCP